MTLPVSDGPAGDADDDGEGHGHDGGGGRLVRGEALKWRHAVVRAFQHTAVNFSATGFAAATGWWVWGKFLDLTSMTSWVFGFGGCADGGVRGRRSPCRCRRCRASTPCSPRPSPSPRPWRLGTRRSTACRWAPWGPRTWASEESP